MAFSRIGSLGTRANKTANQPSSSVTLTATANPGNLVVVVIAVDNNSATDQDEGAVSGVIDSAGGNTWVEGAEFTNSDGGAQNGTTGTIWWSQITNTIPSGGTITASFTASTSRDASAITIEEFGVTSGNTVAVEITATARATEIMANDTFTMTQAGSLELLRVFGNSSETNSSTENLSPAATWSSFTTQATTTGGGSAANMAVRGFFKISTNTTDPFSYLSPGDAANANAQVGTTIGFKEVTPTGDTAGSATGTCTVTGVGQSIVTTVGSAAGTCTVAGVGQSRVAVVGSAAGTCTVSAASLTFIFAVGAAAGTCTVSGTAQSLAQTAGSAVGTCTVTGVGASGVTAVGAAAGTCTVEGIGASTVPVTGNATGSCTVTGVSFVQQDNSEGAGSAAGTCTVTGIAESLAQTVGSAAGTCTVTGVGESRAQTVGTAAGTCTVTGIGVSSTAVVGSAAGTCTVSGIGAARTSTVGNAAGTCTVSGTAQSLAEAVGNAAGACTVTGIGLAVGGASETAGSAAGTCTVGGVGASLAQTTGNASGTCTVSGVLVDANSAANPGPTVGSHGHFFITMGKMGWIKRAA